MMRMLDRLRAAYDGFLEPDEVPFLLSGRQQWFDIASRFEDDLSDAIYHLDRVLRRVRGSRNDAALFRDQMSSYLPGPDDDPDLETT